MKRLFGFLIGILLFNSSFYAQTLDEAKKMYLDGNYRESIPAFEKAIKSAPKNASYNQWYGTCLLETGLLDQSEPYLKFAASKDIQGAYRSLGKLYFLQYRFDESTEAFQEYIDISEKKKQTEDLIQVKALLDKSKHAARMLEYCEDIQIIDSLVVDEKNFLDHYSLSAESGTIQYANEPKTTVVNENQLKNKRFFSKQDSKGNYRLYSQVKLADSWSDEIPLSLPSDSVTEDNYPYVLSDGVTIYYASTGNGSIGGYDLFVTRYNLNKDNYFTPEQLGMPFNSLYNDYMLALDEYNRVGYFATDRFQAENKVVIYTFIPNIEKKVIELENPDEACSRAQVVSIKDSWKKDANYSSLLQQVKNGNKAGVVKEEKKEFDFVINDNIVYHRLDEFESDAAKDLYVQSQFRIQEITTLEQELENKRQDYVKSNDSKKQSLTESILSDERRLEELWDGYEKILVTTRNAEIKYLRQQKN